MSDLDGKTALVTGAASGIGLAPGELLKAGAAEKMVGDAIEALGRLDFLANNAGTSATVTPIPPAELDRLTEEFWATILATNLLGPFRCTRAAAAALKAVRGAVCNTASVAGRNMAGSSMAYGASKAGLITSPRIWRGRSRPRRG